MVFVASVETDTRSLATRLVGNSGVQEVKRNFVRDRPGLVCFWGFQSGELTEHIDLNVHITSVQLLNLCVGDQRWRCLSASLINPPVQETPRSPKICLHVSQETFVDCHGRRISQDLVCHFCVAPIDVRKASVAWDIADRRFGSGEAD